MFKWMQMEPELAWNQAHSKYSNSPAKCTAERDPKTAVNCLLRPLQAVQAKNCTCKSMHPD